MVLLIGFTYFEFPLHKRVINITIERDEIVLNIGSMLSYSNNYVKEISLNFVKINKLTKLL